MRALLLALAFAAGLAGAAQAQAPAPAAAASDSAENSGQDPANPVRRFDVRLQYQRIGDGLNAWILTPRVDMPFQIGNGWRLNTRVDAPIMLSDVPSAENINGSDDLGLGDVLTQALFIKPAQGSAFVAGAQLILPTAMRDQLGTGKWRLLPTAGMVFYPSFMSRGSFVGAIARYDFDFAGDSSRADVSALSLQPIVNFALPERWFVTLAPEMKIDFEDESSVFFPFDVTVGRKVTATQVISLEFKHKLIEAAKEYDWSLEARVGFFF